MKILVACEESQAVTIEMRRLNHCMWILNLQFQLITLHDGGMHIICLG